MQVNWPQHGFTGRPWPGTFVLVWYCNATFKETRTSLKSLKIASKLATISADVVVIDDRACFPKITAIQSQNITTRLISCISLVWKQNPKNHRKPRQPVLVRCQRFCPIMSNCEDPSHNFLWGRNILKAFRPLHVHEAPNKLDLLLKPPKLPQHKLYIYINLYQRWPQTVCL